MQRSKSLFQSRDLRNVSRATGRALTLDDAAKREDAKRHSFYGDRLGRCVLVGKGPKAVHVHDDIKAIAEGIAADQGRSKGDTRGDERAPRRASGLGDAWIGNILEPQIQILGGHVRTLQQRRARADEEIADSQPVELAKEAELSLGQGGIGQS